MQRETLFLRVVVILVGIPVLGLLLWLPWIANAAVEVNQELAYLKYPGLVILYVTAIPFFLALYQALRLLRYIDDNRVLTDLSVISLRNIKYCAVTISLLYGFSMPFLVLAADKDDAPGIVAIGLVITFASIVIAAFAAVLQKLFKTAIDIKSDNDLTI